MMPPSATPSHDLAELCHHVRIVPAVTRVRAALGRGNPVGFAAQLLAGQDVHRQRRRQLVAVPTRVRAQPQHATAPPHRTQVLDRGWAMPDVRVVGEQKRSETDRQVIEQAMAAVAGSPEHRAVVARAVGADLARRPARRRPAIDFRAPGRDDETAPSGHRPSGSRGRWHPDRRSSPVQGRASPARCPGSSLAETRQGRPADRASSAGPAATACTAARSIRWRASPA